MVDLPIDISQVKPISNSELSVNRVFEKVDESKGLDSHGQFLSATANTTGIFKK